MARRAWNAAHSGNPLIAIRVRLLDYVDLPLSAGGAVGISLTHGLLSTRLSAAIVSSSNRPRRYPSREASP
jgi:hypothetical protein